MSVSVSLFQEDVVLDNVSRRGLPRGYETTQSLAELARMNWPSLRQ